MIHQLKEIYTTIIPFAKEKSEQYHWYETGSGEIFGIHEDEITEKDQKLLQTFCTTYEPHLPEKDAKEQVWHERIFEGNDAPPSSPFRFIYFSLHKNQLSPVQFKEAFGKLFEESLPILWETETTRIIIEEMEYPEEAIRFEQIINILMADLSVNIRFLVGPTLEDVTNIASEYTTMIDMGRNFFASSKQKVIHYIEAIPYLLIQQLPAPEREKLAT